MEVKCVKCPFCGSSTNVKVTGKTKFTSPLSIPTSLLEFDDSVYSTAIYFIKARCPNCFASYYGAEDYAEQREKWKTILDELKIIIQHPAVTSIKYIAGMLANQGYPFDFVSLFMTFIESKGCKTTTDVLNFNVLDEFQKRFLSSEELRKLLFLRECVKCPSCGVIDHPHYWFNGKDKIRTSCRYCHSDIKIYTV